MGKNILQAISGGYDSTWLLIRNLKRGDSVYPLYVYGSCINGLKQNIESTAVKNLIRKLKRRFKNLHDLAEVKIGMRVIAGINSEQPFIWLMGLFSEIQNQKCRIDYDEVHIGYISTDSAVSQLKEITTLWNCLFSFSLVEDTIPELQFPLTDFPKEIAIANLKKYDRSILESCWTCEYPRILQKKPLNKDVTEVYIEPCGECTPCENIKHTLGISFDSLKKYKAVFHKSDFINAFKSVAVQAAENINFDIIPGMFLSFKPVNNKTIEKMHKSLDGKIPE
jgi:7-cyano-7-deazaguanine synthase in queuosine biosynthesis